MLLTWVEFPFKETYKAPNNVGLGPIPSWNHSRNDVHRVQPIQLSQALMPGRWAKGANTKPFIGLVCSQVMAHGVACYIYIYIICYCFFQAQKIHKVTLSWTAKGHKKRYSRVRVINTMFLHKKSHMIENVAGPEQTVNKQSKRQPIHCNPKPWKGQSRLVIFQIVFFFSFFIFFFSSIDMHLHFLQTKYASNISQIKALLFSGWI